MPSSISVSMTERDVLKAILEFLERHNFHISQLSLERETGIINGDYSEDLLFLRQLILDGQWDNALDFITPLKEVSDFNLRSFRYFINKYKYYELLCIKQEPGIMHDNDFAVEEIVECLKELEYLCSSSEEFRRLCALLTLKKLSDHEDLNIWNPSSARVECFYKILPLVSELLQNNSESKKSSIANHAVNERLIQLFAKGMLYEAAVDYCQTQALEGSNAAHPQSRLTEVLLPREKLSQNDLSLISWLEVIGNEQFTIPFQQKTLEFKLESLTKPKLEAQWAEQILATPIKPGGQFPHCLVPKVGLKCAQKISQSMILPLVRMSSSLLSGNSAPVDGIRYHPMSQSIGGFSINIKTLDDETMRQSQKITSMLKSVLDETKHHQDPQFQSTSSGIYSANSMSASYSSIPSGAKFIPSAQLPHCRQELDAICRRNQSVVPGSIRGGSLPPVPELPTPDGASLSSVFVDQTEVLSLTNDRNPMINSRLFQEFSNKIANSGYTSELVQRPVQQPHMQANVAFRYNSAPQQFNFYSQRPASNCVQFPFTTPNEVLQRPHSYSEEPQKAWNNNNTNHLTKKVNRPSNLNLTSSAVSDASSGVDNRIGGRENVNPLQFVPLCRYEDTQAIRAVAFHPSGNFFAIGTNSKQMHICKYPDIRQINSRPNFQTQPPEILLSRPKQHRGSVYCCGFNQSGELLATGSNDKTLRLMAFNADECRIGAEMELNIHEGTVRELIFMEDISTYSSIIVSAGNCRICLTDCTNGQLLKSFTGHTGPIFGLYNWGSNTSFASCSQDRTIRFWDLRASSSVNVISPNAKATNIGAIDSPVNSVCVDPSGKLLVSGHEDASVMLYDIIGGRVVQIYRPHGDEVRTVRCSNAAYYLLSGSYDKRVVITDIRGDLTAPLIYLPVAEHASKVIQCRWHPHDFTFLSTSADKTAVLWSLPQLGD